MNCQTERLKQSKSNLPLVKDHQKTVFLHDDEHLMVKWALLFG